jgi:nucleoside-diphosphate-sugar epimerase/glycosyltransferase involved in cell wall biosynthesis
MSFEVRDQHSQGAGDVADRRSVDRRLAVSVVILTMNEEANIAACIASCAGWCDDVHVLDSGSTDRTCEIARSLGATVHHHPFRSFGEQRNWAIDRIAHRHDWIFHLDADERFTPELVREMRDMLNRNPREAGFYVPHKLIFMGRWLKHAEGYPVYQMRFFHKQRMRFRDYGHGQRELTSGKIGRLRSPYLHYNFSKGIDDWLEKHNRYSTLEARQVYLGKQREPEHQLSPFGGSIERRRYFKAHIYPKIPGKYLWRFLWMYVGKMGFLDGVPGLHYCLLMSTYELLTSLKLREMTELAPAAAATTARAPRRSRRRELHDADDALPPPYVERIGRIIPPGTRAIVTGGSGFIGTNLIEYLRHAGVDVVSVDHSPPRNPKHQPLWNKIDLLDRDAITKLVRDVQPELMFHLAARTDLRETKDLDGYASNTAGVDNVLHATEGVTSLKRIIITSSQLVCEPGYAQRHVHDYRPHTVYGESKVQTERITFAWQNPPCPWVLTRPTSIWGPWFDEPYRNFFIAVAKGRYFHQRGVDPRRTFGFVGNVLYQFVVLSQAPAEQVAGRVFYMSDYDPISVRHWADVIQREMGVPRVREIPVEALAGAAKVGDLCKHLGWRNPPMTTFRLKNLTSDNLVDASATRSVVGALPYTLDEGVRMTVRWLRDAGLIPTQASNSAMQDIVG